MDICELNKENAQAFLDMQLQLDSETDMMLFEVGERSNDINRIYGLIDSIQNTGSVAFLAYEDGQCIGFLFTNRGQLKRVRHSAYIVIGILEKYRGKGIGTALFENVIRWAKNCGIKRLELTVMTHNQAGLALYKKQGFEIEGVKKAQSLSIMYILMNITWQRFFKGAVF
ncbi:MAG: GNAT family N-acetyltransferase [Defluviitaleaceae bacterium]|nr:GNAT family N-acetyltransferase [Defluviitaleaceae bacterium]